jgi:hypothetical protein
MNYKRIYRALSKAKKLQTPVARLRALRIASQLSWSCSPLVYRKME